jgi:YHS domain-containing protein
MTAGSTAHDPVCHMDIDPATAAGTSEYQGRTYYFCALGCKKDFDEDPEGVLKAEAEYDHGGPREHGMSTAGEQAPRRRPWWRFWG